MLCHYSCTIVPKVNNNITYNGKNMLLNTNLSMSHTYIKQVICHGLGWNHNDV